MTIKIREATLADAALILGFITELAIYEKAEHEVVANIADIERTLFSQNQDNLDKPHAHALICEVDNTAVGFAVYFFSYSTWLGRKGLYLEDLYISPVSRGQGAGKVLLRHLAKIACDSGCGRFEWSVLDWNEPAIQFYERIGASAQSEWIRYRMAGEALQQFANDKDDD